MKTSYLFLPVFAGVSLTLSAQGAEVSASADTSTTRPAIVSSTTAPESVATPVSRSFRTPSATASEIVKMQQAGLESSVIRAYIQNLRVPYKATAEDILFLHDQRVADELICDWIKRGGELVTLAAQVPATSPDLVANSFPQNQAPGQAQMVQQQPQVIYQQPPQVAAPSVVYSAPAYTYADSYAYPYGYGYDYVPPISLGFSWGWGGPYWGGGFGHPYYGGFRGGFRGPIRTGFTGHFGGGHFNGGGHAGGGFGGHRR